MAGLLDKAKKINEDLLGSATKSQLDPAGLVKEKTGLDVPGANLFFGSVPGVFKDVTSRLAKDNMPDYQRVDERGLGLINQQVDEANLSPEQLLQRRMAGQKEAAQLGVKDVPQELQLESARLGGAQPAGFQEALAKRSQQDVLKDVARRERELASQIPMEQFNLSGRAFESLAKSYDLRLQQKTREYQAVVNKIAARNQAISSLAKGVGTLAGFALGGPAGAGVGGAAAGTIAPAGQGPQKVS